MHELSIAAPVRRPSCVAEQHVSGSRRRDRRLDCVSIIATGRAMPFADHLAFVLKHEDVDLLVLKRIFAGCPQAEIEALVREAPTAVHVRRAWFLYETLTGAYPRCL